MKAEVSVTPVEAQGQVWMRCAVLFALGLTASAAHAEDSPFSLTASQSFKHDSNFSRNSLEQSENVSTTTLRGDLNKDYGRQNYRAGVAIGAQRYTHFKELKNDNKDANLGFTSGIASNWVLSLGGAYSQNLNPIQNNNNGQARVTRNIRTYNDQNIALQYGNGGRWAIVGQLDGNRVKYSDSRYFYQNANQTVQGLKAIYNSTDLLNFGLGLRLVNTRYPATNNEELSDRNIDFSVNSRISGLSSFYGMVSRRQGHYKNADRNTSGWTGQAVWNYTPRGLVSYTASLSRSTGADRYQQGVSSFADLLSGVQSYDINYDTTTTSANLNASLKATGKITVNAGYTFTKYDLSRVQTPQGSQVFSDRANITNSHYRGMTLGVNYAVLRNLNLGCAYTDYKQTPDSERVAYQGNQVDCKVSYTLD